ncbi:Maf family protein [Tepidibacter formicigenes]|jgi:septum formation protein|uniref:dTTP/UTP pyrophosphatase n=1 Tax=Tepidibacter formicigenes DSM 15518 TaxID=1123349 RepID=A0A1M6K1W2_9FIRM|nr:Maf family protein [Tepidibacter formicigenes]SHJ52852.1 septum formation protein [Tepidibacter formicigenes DSM 15518]
MKIILASSSPRRRELLLNLNLKFKVIKSEVKESVDINSNPKTVAMSLAFQKALDVANKVEESEIVIGADTIVVFDNEILGKPNDEEDAFNMIKKLSGKYHEVITGISVIRLSDNKKVVDCEITKVKMKDIDDYKIRRYIDTKEPMDKAGSYGIQGYGSLLVEKIEGDYFSVVGLPVAKLEEILSRHFGINII